MGGWVDGHIPDSLHNEHGNPPLLTYMLMVDGHVPESLATSGAALAVRLVRFGPDHF